MHKRKLPLSMGKCVNPIFLCIFSPTLKALYLACYLFFTVKFRDYPLVVYEHLIFFQVPPAAPKTSSSYSVLPGRACHDLLLISTIVIDFILI